MNARTQNGGVVDASAITLSSLCIAHCILLPIAVPFISVAGAVAEMEWLHKVFVAAAIPISAFAMIRSADLPGRMAFTQLAVLGLAMLVAAAFVPALHDFERVLTVAGALSLAIAHVWRWKAHAHR
ncbi:MAG: MerC domain-containing protein [Pseudomonadota bacterium]